MTEHPITPPPELIQRWSEQFEAGRSLYAMFEDIYRAGADAELDACCELLNDFNTYHLVELLRAACTRKPPSLKEQALALVEQHEDGWRPSPKDWDTIRLALEALPDD
jgi:hypothetical protein